MLNLVLTGLLGFASIGKLLSQLVYCRDLL